MKFYKDLIIVGSTTGEGYTAAPGHVRAFNAKTGEFAWIFHTIPQENRFGYDTWNWIEGENYGKLTQRIFKRIWIVYDQLL